MGDNDVMRVYSEFMRAVIDAENPLAAGQDCHIYLRTSPSLGGASHYTIRQAGPYGLLVEVWDVGFSMVTRASRGLAFYPWPEIRMIEPVIFKPAYPGGTGDAGH